MSATARGAFVLSLDFELHWGIRDHTSATAPSLWGAREAVSRLLDAFAERDIACTWATVGLLFAATRDEQQAAAPETRPVYGDPALDAYAQSVGPDEAADPVHFGASLVARIRDTPRQELATHTFSHFYCGEPGATPQAFRADLLAAQRVAGGEALRSIVFPRNQSGPDYVAALPEAGVDVYRGNPSGRLWRVEDGASGRSLWRRVGRALDTYVPVGGDDTVGWDTVVEPGGLANVRASRFLRPYAPRLARLEPVRLRRITAGLLDAARRGRIFHLWWHPHNFGTHLGENMAVLGRILDAFERARDAHGMESLTMAEVADRARALG